MEDQGENLVLLEALGATICQCPKEQIMRHKLTPYFLACDDTSSLPDILQTLLNHCCPLLNSALRPVQVTAYFVLNR